MRYNPTVSPIIDVANLKKYYQVAEKQAGFGGAIRSFFSRSYKEVRAVDDISFEIEAGELVGFIGPNGAGKTTTLKVLSGLLYPTAGDIKVSGFTPWERRDEFLKSISLVMGQKNQLWWDLPSIDTFELNQATYEIPAREFKKTLGQLTGLLGTEHLLNTPVRKLSLGERMKMELIASLLHKPRVLFLDEPTIGLDVVMQKVLRDFILQYNRQFGATIILTSHYMADVRELAKRVIIIDKGKLLYDGQLKDIVQRFSKSRIINIVFEGDLDPKKLARYGDLKSYDYPNATLSISQVQVASVVSEILNNFPVADLTVEEIPIEDVVRKIFTRGLK